MEMNQSENEERVAEEYLSSLSDLNCNSKPLINMLTILAEENIQYAPVIVKVVEEHISKVQPEYKLPILYLIDSIVKNVKNGYVQLFSQCIINIFCGVFETVNEKIRERMYALRLTWNDVFSAQKLYALDVKVKRLDNNWPITAKQGQPSIHVNPNFLKNVSGPPAIPADMEEILHAKTRELLELKKRKLELELEATKKHLAEQEKQLTKATESVIAVGGITVADSNTHNIQKQKIPNTLIERTHQRIMNPQIPVHSLMPEEKTDVGTYKPNFQASQAITSRRQELSQEEFTSATNVNSESDLVDSSLANRDPRRSLIRRRKHSNRDLSESLKTGGKISTAAHRNNRSNAERLTISDSKLPTKHSNQSSVRSSKNYSKYENNKDKGRKRYFDSKSSPSSDRKKINSTCLKTESSQKYNKAEFEIGSLSVSLKRKSHSPSSSPNKKDSKRCRNPNERLYKDDSSRSLSPKLERSKDVDLRLLACLENQSKLTNSDIGLEDQIKVTSTKHLDKTSAASAQVDVISKAPIALRKSDYRTNYNDSTSSKVTDSGMGKMSIETNENSNLKCQLLNAESKIKKNKSAKFDNLFGTEDVDLRTIPLQISVVQRNAAADILTPPPPPVISNKESTAVLTNDNDLSKKPTENSSNLEDVRAKLAKAAKFSKIGAKNDKQASQKIKLEEFTVNEDSQEEANDEKIRTIIAQAQELLQSKSMSMDQYKNLVKTVITINETNKLKTAKRLESLRTTKLQNIPCDEDDLDKERKAARAVILKKRIPKLIKDQNVATSKHKSETSAKSPVYEDKNDSQRTRFTKERRNKILKWSDRMDSNNSSNQNNSFISSSSQRGWQNSHINKRIFGGFRSSVPHPPLPPLLNPNLNIPQVQWPLNPNDSTIFSSQMDIIHGIPPPPQPPNVINIGMTPTPLTPKPCNSIDNPQSDMVRTITIDGQNKEIRIYNQVAIVFMDQDQPREIGFQDGLRKIYIDSMEPFTLKFNDDYKHIIINGESHLMRFGFPSRELYVDEDWYEIYFGGPAVSVPIKGKMHMLKAEGPPPQVNIGPIRQDLVVGKINMIVEAHIIIPLFLDATLQTFFLDDSKHTIQFADNLLTILLDGKPAHVDYGGLPKSFLLGSKKYYIRFSSLPKNIIPGNVFIKDMTFVNLDPAKALKTTNDNQTKMEPENLTSFKILNKSDELESTKQRGVVVTSNEVGSSSIPMIPTAALNKLNIDELFQKLVSSGILSNPVVPTREVDNADNKTIVGPTSPITLDNTVQEKTSRIDLTKMETIKARQIRIINSLYSGMQCSSCGLRFPPEETIKYSQHLDWHFRRNRRERDSTRKAHSRKWYYEFTDWIQYEEIEDLEDRAKKLFESQQCKIDMPDDTSNPWVNSPAPSCAAGPDNIERYCDMCHEKFEQFYNEELEEWHLSCALKVNDKFYHPLCFEDFKAALNPRENEAKQEDGQSDDAMVDKIVVKTEQNIDNKLLIIEEDDDDDDVIVLPNEEPSVTEIIDEDNDDADANDDNDGNNDDDDSDDDDDDDDNNHNDNDKDNDDETVNKKLETLEKNVANGIVADETETNIFEKSHDTGESDIEIEIQEPQIPFTDLDTYVEKELPLSNTDQIISILDIKIKEEPKDDIDDDGFEDVGTVLIIPEEEISVNSNDEAQTQINISERALQSKSVSNPDSMETLEMIKDPQLSIDGNIEPEKEHNLSLAGPAPAMPLSNLVNKIKINISKNISTNTVTPKVSTIETNYNNVICKNTRNFSDTSSISTISSIPVLCSGSTISATVTTSNTNVPISSVPHFNNRNRLTTSESTVSNISVIGSYEKSYSASRYNSHVNAQKSLRKQMQSVPKDSVAYELKPVLQKIPLQRTKKVEIGAETSGLCSIM